MLKRIPPQPPPPPKKKKFGQITRIKYDKKIFVFHKNILSDVNEKQYF